MFSSHCLLGSVNCQFSTLRKKEVLVLNKDRIELAVQSLPNAKRVLFGRTFHRLPQSKMIYREALLRTWVELHGHRSADARANAYPQRRKTFYQCLT